MAGITIKHRETEAFALSRKDIIKVSIETGKILVDNRVEFFGPQHVIKGGKHNGFSKS